MGNGVGRMVRWAVEDGRVGGGCRRAGKRPDRASDLPVVGRRLVELILRAGLGIGEVEGGGLIEVKFGLRRAASGGHPGRLMRQVEMEEDAIHGGGEGDEGDDPHLAFAGGAQEWEHLIDAGQKLGPEHAAGS